MVISKNKLYITGLSTFNEELGVDGECLTPTLVTNNAIKIDGSTSLYAATHHAAIVTGGLSFYSLGLGSVGLETFTFNHEIQKVALGGNFTLILTRDCCIPTKLD